MIKITSAKIQKKILVKVLALSLAGCSTTGINNSTQTDKTGFVEDPCASIRNAQVGAVAGAAFGAIVAIVIDNKMNKGKERSNSEKTNDRIRSGALGGVLGGGVGYLIGQRFDKRDCEIFKIAQESNMQMLVQHINVEKSKPSDPNTNRVGSVVSLSGEDSQFLSGSAELTPQGRQVFLQIAKNYVQVFSESEIEKKEDQLDLLARRTSTKIFLIGHTDDTGPTELNAQLAEKRAKAVADLFSLQGIDPRNIFYQGAGELYPIESNATPQGRSKNRRVEIVDVSNEENFRKYLDSRTSNLAYFRAEILPTVVPTQKNQPSISQVISKPTKNDNSEIEIGNETKNATAISKRKIPPSAIDFGGNALTQIKPIDIGKVDNSDGWFVRSAVADNKPIDSCAIDRFRASSGVKSLSTNREYRTAEYLSGLNKSSWTSNENGHLVSLTNVSVLRTSGLPEADPVVLVYKDYSNKKDKNPYLKTISKVNVYKGEKAILYRVFVEKESIQCMDLILPPDGGSRASTTIIYGTTDQRLEKATQMSKVQIK